jgi:hypothetical protein
MDLNGIEHGSVDTVWLWQTSHHGNETFGSINDGEMSLLTK